MNSSGIIHTFFTFIVLFGGMVKVIRKTRILWEMRVYTSIYPAILWQDQGIAAFDMSVSEQDKNCSYYCLKELLKTQTPSVVCVEMYGLMFDSHSRKGDEYRNILAKVL